MGRLALQPRYIEVDHLPNGDVELWDPATTSPLGWTLNGGANGVGSLETVEIFEGRQSAKLVKNASGALYWSLVPKQSLVPGLYYRVRAGVRRGLLGTAGVQSAPRVRLRNLTLNTSLSSTGAFTSGATFWNSGAGTLWRSLRLWLQVPTTYGPADSWIAEMGVFGTGTGGADTWFDSYSLIGPYVRPIHIAGLAPLTYAALARKEIVVTLTKYDRPTPSDPWSRGIEIDITRRVKLDGLGTITEGAEEEILRLTHGDMTLTLDDRDGFLRSLFQDATATDRWELVILTETGRAHGLKWDRLFAGVLDLPWSVSFEPRERETTIQVFSYTKALENASATAVGRSVTGRTFTISAASKNATTNDTTDLLRGDQITARVSVSGVSTQETFTVDRVDSATAFRVKDAAQNAFTAADLSLDTYFHREKTASFLAGAVCDAASVQNREINLGSELATFPLAQPIAAHGLGLATIPMSLVPQSGKIEATFIAGDETKRKETAGPTSPWTDGATSNLAQLDWTPYLDTEPGTIQNSKTLAVVIPDTGLYAPDHATGYIYRSGFGGGFTMHLFRHLNGGVALDLGVSMSAGFPQIVTASVEFAPPNNRVFMAHRSPGLRELRYWDGTFHTISTAVSGNLRWIRYGSGGILVMVDDETNDIVFLDGSMTTFAPLSTFPWPTTDKILHWTMRTWGEGATVGGLIGRLWFTFLFERAGETWVAIFDARGQYGSWHYVASYRVAGSVSAPGPTITDAQGLSGPKAYQTLTTLPDGREVAIGYAAGEWFVLSTRLDGIVPYADFTGLSCAGALKELAVSAIAYLDTDRYNVVTLMQRPSFLAATPVQAIDDPLDRTSFPIWEFYRTAVKVSGKDALGAGFTVIQGIDGGSAKMFELSSPLISTAGMALAISLLYFAYLNRIVRQENIRIDEPEERVRVLDVVNFDDAKWLATDVQSNTRDREQTLRLFEVR